VALPLTEGRAVEWRVAELRRNRLRLALDQSMLGFEATFRPAIN
jgi:hypothetical protein